MPDLLNLLKSGTRGHPQCYTCNHPAAKSLTERLMVSLKAEQQEGRMLRHPISAVHKAVQEECDRQEKPYKASLDAFRNHVRYHLHG